MSEPDYDFWRAERARLLGKRDWTLADIVCSTARLLDAIDIILETETTIEKIHDDYALERKAEGEYEPR